MLYDYNFSREILKRTQKFVLLKNYPLAVPVTCGLAKQSGQHQKGAGQDRGGYKAISQGFGGRIFQILIF